jgi:glycosyltransferase involved in cell wall biosynthesis
MQPIAARHTMIEVPENRAAGGGSRVAPTWRANPTHMRDNYSIHLIFPNFYLGSAVSYALKSLADSMQSSRATTHTYALAAARERRNEVHTLLPITFYRYTNHLIRRPSHALYRRFQHRIKQGDIAYFWLDNPPELTRALQARGVTVVREMINCTQQLRRYVLTHAHSLLGRSDDFAVSDQHIEAERRELLAADAVICPSPNVYDSVRAYGVPAERCIRASYGWSEARMRGDAVLAPKAAGVDFLFVGSGDVRKGLPWLLRAWERAAVPGRLLLAGRIEPQIRRDHATTLARADVVELGHVADVGAAYRSADVFCLPSWEEGCPMVTVEAMAMGLACIVSPMGAAGLLSAANGDALVVEPGNVDALAAAISQLASDATLRDRLKHRSRSLAAGLTWTQVGQRRLNAIEQLLAEPVFGQRLVA